ncbi:MAG TPA: (2Fe-2S) ferredoxin domain-containing protein [Clostridia bacterium]|jgi:NADH:ubiquinone oxidoreductase subunit E|nr:(2Fe-2S) ferredoxin domain-containing protein [Clostridiaceae bacterium]HPZ52909.1 (2Fe-2S) ferredoxin domain-containing protein [Clostridia bacterium]
MEIRVCIGSSCYLKGSRDVINELNHLIKENSLNSMVTLKGSFCMGKCSMNGVTVCCDDRFFFVEPDNVDDFFKNVIVPSIPRAI